MNRWEQEAELQGWEFVRKAGNGNAEYRHRTKPDGSPCNETRIASAGSMRKGAVRCTACSGTRVRWFTEAEASGWKMVRQVDSHYAEYRHLLKPDGTVCGATRLGQATQMRLGTVSCPECDNPMKRWASEAEANGWELVRKVDRASAEYRHKQRADGSPCGALRVAQAALVRVGSARCPECEGALPRWRADAEAHGWELVRRVNGQEAEYRHKARRDGTACGFTVIGKALAMRNGRLKCSECSWKAKPSVRNVLAKVASIV